MDLNQFAIGAEFLCGGRRWRCTDIGMRTVVAIRVDGVDVTTRIPGEEPRSRPLTGSQAEAEGWFNGPPYAVAETVFDEDDREGCEPAGGG